MIQTRTLRQSITVMLATGVILLLEACTPGEPARPDPGPMGSTATGSDADLPDRNSQSTPIQRP